MKKKTTINLILLLLLLLFISFLVLKTKKYKSELLKSPKFTVAEITSNWHSKTTFNGPGYDFEYNIDGKKYQSTVNQYNDNVFRLGRKFLFVYDTSNNNFGYILPIYPLSDTITYPLDGWKLEEVPIDIDLRKIEEYILKR